MLHFFYFLTGTLRKIGTPSSIDLMNPCNSLINGLFVIVKDDILIAVDKKSGEVYYENTKHQDQALEPYQHFSWTCSVRQLGNWNYSFLQC